MRYCEDIANLLLWVIWEYLIMPINNDNINLTGKFDALSVFLGNFDVDICMQKINLTSLTSFLSYCKDIANLLFWELWECLTISIKIILSICCKLLYWSACKKPTSSHNSFLRYCKEIAQLIILYNLGMPGHINLKWQ